MAVTPFTIEMVKMNRFHLDRALFRGKRFRNLILVVLPFPPGPVLPRPHHRKVCLCTRPLCGLGNMKETLALRIPPPPPSLDALPSQGWTSRCPVRRQTWALLKTVGAGVQERQEKSGMAHKRIFIKKEIGSLSTFNLCPTAAILPL